MNQFQKNSKEAISPKKTNSLDLEWVELITESKQIGLAKEDILQFIRQPHQFVK